jgi:hypothetical protein
VASSKRLSESLWGIDYAQHFPLALGEELSVGVADVSEALQFAGEHFAGVFGTAAEATFWTGGSAEARVRYLERVCDLFIFRDRGEAVGLFVGNPVDWSTYYIRSTVFLRAYQGRALYQRFLSTLFQLLGDAGVERVEAETAPSNLQCVIALTRQRFFASGSALTDRWGALTKFTCHLHAAPKAVFLRQYCSSGDVHDAQNNRQTHS